MLDIFSSVKAAFLTAIFYLLPILFPFFPPGKGSSAGGTYFFRQIAFSYKFHLAVKREIKNMATVLSPPIK
jgi:hypothetical protein